MVENSTYASWEVSFVDGGSSFRIITDEFLRKVKHVIILPAAHEALRISEAALDFLRELGSVLSTQEILGDALEHWRSRTDREGMRDACSPGCCD